MAEQIYKHKLVQALYDLLQEQMAGKGISNPMFGFIWGVLKPELPGMLKSLDENEELMNTIRIKLREVMQEDIKEIKEIG